jgi:hypothetical protein
MHVSQPSVIPENPSVQKTFSEYFPDSIPGFHRKQIDKNDFQVVIGGIFQPFGKYQRQINT